MSYQQRDHGVVEEDQSHRDATYADNQNTFLQSDDQYLLHQPGYYTDLAQSGSDVFLESQEGSNSSSSQESTNNDFPHIYLDQVVDARQSNHQQYMQARSVAAAAASAQYGHRLSIFLSLLVSDQPEIGQDTVIPHHGNQEQADNPVDIDDAQHAIPAVPPPEMVQQPGQAPEPSSKRRYTPEEEQTIATMMQAGATAKEIGQRLDRNPSSILLKWGRMQGRFGDPHAAEKRRRGGRDDQS